MPLLSTSELLDRLGDPFFALDPQGQLTYWNVQAERLLAEWFGGPVEPVREGGPLWRSFPQVAGSPLAAVLRRAQDEHEPIIVQLAVPDGRRVEVRAWPDADGVSVICLDVTPRGIGEQPAVDVLESIGELFIACDRHWRLTYINARAEKYLQQVGLTRGAILGQVVWQALPGLAGSPFHEAALRAVADQTEVEVEAEYPLLHRWFNARIAPTPDGAVSYSRDITARKQAEAAAHESYSLLRAIVDATTDSIYVKDLHGRYVMANGAVLRGMRRSIGEIIGHTDAELFSAESAQVFRANDERVLQSGGTATFEEPFELPGGRTRIHLSTKGVYRDQTGNPVGIVGISRDITRRKVHEEELRASEERFRTLMESIDDLVYELDSEQRIVSLFGRWAERENIDPLSVVGGSVERLFGPDALEVHHQANRRALEGKRVSYEWALRRPGGARHLQLSLSPLRQEDGTVTGLVGVGREITDRVLADRRQHFISEAAAVLGASLDYRTTLATLARLVVPSLADYCLIDLLDSDGRSQRVEFAHIDSAKEQALRERVLSRPPDPRWPRNPIARAVDNGEPIFLPEVDSATVAGFGHDAEHRAYLQELAPISILTVPLRARSRILGALTFCYAESGRRYSPADLTMALDLAARAALAVDNAQLYRAAQAELTQRTRVESELRRWADIFEHAGWGIAMVNADGRTLDALNPAFAEMHGYQGNRLVGRPVTRLLVPGTAPGWFGRAGLRLLRTRQTFESVHRRRDGTTFPALVEVTPVRDESGTLMYYALNVQDLTSQKRVEEQVRQAQKMEAVGRLAGGVAHDFNNMLMIIIGFSDFLAASFAPDDSRRSDADEIRKAAERASALTRQLLTFGRQRVVESSVLDPNSLVLDMEGMLRPLLGERIQLEHSLAGGIGHIRGDRGQLEQVLMNLTLNARDAMPEGGVLRLETAEVTFERGAAYRTIGLDIPAGTYVTLAVHDTGIGMDEATRHRIFEPFFTTKLTAQNSGLGLATVYGIIQQSGGYVWVESTPGSGSIFRICLPRTEAEPPTDSVPLSSPPRGSETILVVEDEEAVRLLAARVLGDLGYTVLTARHGADALSLLARTTEPIRLVVTDVIMPELGGRELAEQIERLYPGMPVLYMSGYTDNEALRDDLDQPGTQFLQKPFSPDSLARKVREVLDRSMAA